jgi:hypothetical protein
MAGSKVKWRNWNWLDDGVLPAAILALRVCWLWPWLLFLQRWAATAYEGVLLPIGLVFAVQALAWVVMRGSSRLAPIRARVVVSLAGLAAVFGVLWWRLYHPTYPLWDAGWLVEWANAMTDWSDWEAVGVPPAFYAFMALAYLWLRGALDGSRLSVLREHVWRTLVYGFVALALLLLAGGLSKDALSEETGNLVWLFGAVGMAALAVSGLNQTGGFATAGAVEAVDGDERPRFDRYWLGSVATIMGAVVALALLLSLAIAPETVSRLAESFWLVLRQLLLYAWIAISFVLLPVAYLLAYALAPLVGRLIEVGNRIGLPLPDSELLRELQPETRGQEGSGLLNGIPDQLRWVVLVLLVVGVVVVFGRTVRRLMRRYRGREGIEEIRETVLSRELLGGQLADMWHRFREKWQGRSHRVVIPYLSLAGEPLSRRMIREAYQGLLELAKAREQPRKRSQTPSEYARILEQEWPSLHGTLDVVTDGYVEARYARHLPSEETAHLVVRAWVVIRDALEAAHSSAMGVEE